MRILLQSKPYDFYERMQLGCRKKGGSLNHLYTNYFGYCFWSPSGGERDQITCFRFLKMQNTRLAHVNFAPSLEGSVGFVPRLQCQT